MNLWDVLVLEPSFGESDAGGASMVGPQALRLTPCGPFPHLSLSLSQLSTDLSCSDVGCGKRLLQVVTGGKGNMKGCWKEVWERVEAGALLHGTSFSFISTSPLSSSAPVVKVALLFFSTLLLTNCLF